jgi:hypothetical protein
VSEGRSKNKREITSHVFRLNLAALENIYKYIRSISIGLDTRKKRKGKRIFMILYLIVILIKDEEKLCIKFSTEKV